MAWALRSDLVLQKAEEEGYVRLYSREPAPYPMPVFRLHPLQAMVLALFDGTRSVEELAEIVSGVFDRTPRQARNLVDSVTRRYRQFLKEPNGDGPAAPADPADLVFATGYDFRVIREPAPVALMWVVTECCTKRCTYCYKDALFVADGRANDLTLSTKRMVELIDEAARIGVMTMVLSGGEPFLRPDLIDLIGVMVGRGMEVVPITKDRITGARMQALARTGLQELHVSLDSHRAETVDFLTGVEGAFDQIVATTAAAAEYGVPVVLRPVLSSVNARDFEGLLELAHTLQVREVMADLYGESCGRHDEAYRVAPVDYAWLRRVTDEATAKYPEMRVSFKFDHSIKEVTAAGRGCVEGSRGMTILPDGRVTKCEHWRFGEELTYGDLRRQSLMEAWQSEAIARLNCSPREAFAGSICGRCKKLEECNERRGRCTLSAMLEYRTPFAPDTYCPIGAFQKRSGHAASA